AIKVENYVLKKYNKWFFYLVFIALYILGIISLSYVVSNGFTEYYYISHGSGESMYPTFIEGDKVMVETKVFKIEEIKRGMIVTVKCEDIYGEKSNDSHGKIKTMQKRVIGLPGEIIKIERGIVYINGNKLNEPWVYYDPEILEQLNDTSIYIYSKHHSWIENDSFAGFIKDTVIVLDYKNNAHIISVPQYKIPGTHFYLLGDNRFHSSDSRRYGTFNINDIKSKALYIKRPLARMRNLIH
ncbi:signal peptidase I, partial [bacterium]|nr:signal peptidase I [bacterium]